MIIKGRKHINFKNECGVKVSLEELRNAINWYSKLPVAQTKRIFISAKYPAVSIYDKKIHIHRLLMMYWEKRDLDRKEYVHHKDRDKLNCLKFNLKIESAFIHSSIHNKNKIVSINTREKIAKANSKRKGTILKKEKIPMEEVISLYKKGMSINSISKRFNADWKTIKKRIIKFENPELLK